MLPRLTQFDLHHRIAENPAPTLVFFSSGGCSSCRHLEPVLEQLALKCPHWVIYEVDAQSEMGLTHEFEIFHLPAMFLFHRGEFHSEISCHASVAAIENAVEKSLQRQAQEAP